MPGASSNLPGSRWRTGPARARQASCSLFGLAPGGVYQASRVASAAVRCYRTISPLPDPPPAPSAGRGHRRCVFCGTFPSLAAGRRYRPPCPAEPGLSSRRKLPVGSSGRRPSGPLRDHHHRHSTGYPRPGRLLARSNLEPCRYSGCPPGGVRCQHGWPEFRGNAGRNNLQLSVRGATTATKTSRVATA